MQDSELHGERPAYETSRGLSVPAAKLSQSHHPGAIISRDFMRSRWRGASRLLRKPRWKWSRPSELHRVLLGFNQALVGYVQLGRG